uniref:hypothetical protein n=1 Tax=Nonomuraea sp. CA-251285 TaxID=3240002 RepID=UPI003F4922CD
MSVLASMPAAMPAPDTLTVAPGASARYAWLEAAAYAASNPDHSRLELVTLAMASLPGGDAILHPDRLAWLFTSFYALHAAVADLDAAQWERLVVDRIDPDPGQLEAGAEPVVAMFEQEVGAALRVLLAGPAGEAP